MRHYCTYFDSNYLLQGLCLYHSLEEHSHQPFTLWVLCFDKLTYQILKDLSLPKMRLIQQDEFENEDESLLLAKHNRARVEYFWTCTPSLPLFILEQNPQVDLITYLDADLFFFSDPEPVFKELGTGSILIVGHRFPPELADRELYGIYNVGVMCFRRDENGLEALRWWRERCNEWCYMRLEDGRYGDQKYLDDWPDRFKNVVVLQHRGAGLAPWNLAGNTISIKRKRLFLDDDTPLIFYHFHRFKMVTGQIFAHGTEIYARDFNANRLTYNHVRNLYIPYAQAMGKYQKAVTGRHPDAKNFYKKAPLIQLLYRLAKGNYLLNRDHFINHLIVSASLWRVVQR